MEEETRLAREAAANAPPPEPAPVVSPETSAKQAFENLFGGSSAQEETEVAGSAEEDGSEDAELVPTAEANGQDVAAEEESDAGQPESLVESETGLPEAPAEGEKPEKSVGE